MTITCTNKQRRLAVSCALALGIVSGAATAETEPGHTSYLVDERGNVVRSGYGECWHTGTGPAESNSECNPKVAPVPVAKVVAPTPQPVAVAAAPREPAPQPVVVAVATPVVERVTLDADTLFDFDKAVLRPAGRATLDDFVSRIGDINPEMITAVGHADRFGSEGYNQRLSEQRVEAVRTYLVSKGIDPNRMRTEGKGESQPLTKSGDCDGIKSARVIACLQADRRVEVEVAGTRIVR